MPYSSIPKGTIVILLSFKFIILLYTLIKIFSLNIKRKLLFECCNAIFYSLCPRYNYLRHSPRYYDSRQSPRYNNLRHGPRHDDLRHGPRHDDSRLGPRYNYLRYRPRYEDSRHNLKYNDKTESQIQ